MFQEVIPGSRFQCLVQCAREGTPATGITPVRNKLNQPSLIRIPKGARVTNGSRVNCISKLNTMSDLARLVNEWRPGPEDDGEKPEYGSAYLAYEDESVHWLPIILDEDGRPLLLCNAKVPPDEFQFEIGHGLPRQAVGAQAILPAGGSNILRRSALMSLGSRLSCPPGWPPTRCQFANVDPTALSPMQRAEC